MKDFDDLKKIVRTARDPYKGKPTECNTRVRLLKGTASDPEILAVHFHSTDILRYYPDGRIDLVTGWEKSPTTNQRIREYAGIYRRQQKLPTFYRRLPDPSRVYCVSHKGTEGHIVSSSYDDYIRYRADGTIDLDSVKPMEFSVWKDQKIYRKLMARGREICDQIVSAQRLGYNFNTVHRDHDPDRLDDWLMARLTVPLAEVVPVMAPTMGATFINGKMDPHHTLRSISLMVAHRFDLLETIKLKNF